MKAIYEQVVEMLKKNKEKEIILNKIEQLQKQLEELEAIERTNDFIRLLRGVLLNDKCAIILQGHNEWQFNEKYLMKDLTFEYRDSIAESLQEIIKTVNQGERIICIKTLLD